jgi:propionate CoA-transferase
MREGISNQIHFTIEHGPIGGVPAYGLNFGAALNPDVILDVPTLLDYYNGGGLDIACLGLLEADRWGNVNASKFAESRTAGGFIDISQNARKLIFCTTFTQGAEIRIAEGKVGVVKDGNPKFVSAVAQITFNGKNAAAKGQPVLFISERAVFRLDQEGMVLIEIAPGINVEQDILPKMGFKPIISPDLKEMAPVIFGDSVGVGLNEMFNERRLEYDD